MVRKPVVLHGLPYRDGDVVLVIGKTQETYTFACNEIQISGKIAAGFAFRDAHFLVKKVAGNGLPGFNGEDPADRKTRVGPKSLELQH
jgi:hypothetical protein